MKYIIYSVLILFMISCGSSSENSSEESDTNSIKEFAFHYITILHYIISPKLIKT